MAVRKVRKIRRPGEVARQVLRNMVRLLYGDTLDEKISNLTVDRMKQLIADRSVHGITTGRSEAEIIADYVEATIDGPPREPVAPDIVIMPDGRWALSGDATALKDLAEQAHAAAVLADARAAFAD